MTGEGIRKKQDEKPRKKSRLTGTEWCGQGEKSLGSAHRKYMMNGKEQKSKEEVFWYQMGLG